MSESEVPAAKRELLNALEEIAETVRCVDASGGPEAAATLERRLPFEGDQVERVRALVAQGLEEGWAAPRSGGPKVQFGRLAKDMHGFAVDCVVMEDGAGLGHTHTRGEFNMCFPWSGEPKFDGMDPGWVVFAPGTHHVPTVTGGKMVFIYFTPGGEVVWD